MKEGDLILVSGITQQNRTTERVRNTTKNSSVGERRTARGGTTRPDECSRLLGHMI